MYFTFSQGLCQWQWSFPFMKATTTLGAGLRRYICGAHIKLAGQKQQCSCGSTSSGVGSTDWLPKYKPV